MNVYNYIILYSISKISKKPKKPKIGYKRFKRLEKPILLQKIPTIHISIEKKVNCFLLFDVFFKKLNPAETAVVKIAINIVKLYKYL